jgi:uncharacterized protein (TIGR02452 family)
MNMAPEYDRISVWKRTVEKYKDAPERESIVLKEFQPYPTHYTPIIEFVKEDCVDAALRETNPLLLNMADWEIAGGCVTTGSAAQEEELFRRSDYHKVLLQTYYPMEPLQTIISKDVEFYCSGIKDGYVPYDAPRKIDCVAAPAVRFPYLDRGRGFNSFGDPKDAKLMEEKIQMLFHAAHMNGNETIILSAWGCGAYGCPTDHVAEIFKSVISKGVPVKKIVFAILGPNFQPFKDSFEACAC